MSYLSPLRLHFAGTFQASPSTVNNDPTHFNNATFKPEYRQRQTPGHPNGWWNPGGGADWTFTGCTVTSAWMPDGPPCASTDAVLGAQVANAASGPPAKLVDLDSEQQLVSEIWGLQVRILDASGASLLQSSYQPAAFMDIWDRCPSAQGDELAGAMYQSVLTNLQWGDLSASPFLQQLKATASDGLLSIKFNVDSYNATFGTPTFLQGRIVGTIGPATVAEPSTFVPGHQLMATQSGGNFFAPAGGINFCVANVDTGAGKVYLDLGNALPITASGGAAQDLGTLVIGSQPPPGPSSNPPRPVNLGSVDASVYTDPSWYATSAGVVALPADRTLTADELDALGRSPLTITRLDATGNGSAGIAEPDSGVFVRAEQFVYRLSPGDTANVKLFATRYGRPYPNATVIPVIDPSGLQGPTTPSSDPTQPPPVGAPSTAITVPPTVETGADGTVMLSIGSSDPANPRSYIDGQVYGVRPVLEETVSTPGEKYPFNPWLFVSLLVWDTFQTATPPTWYGDLQPVFQQYWNLYPVMDQFLNLSDPQSVWQNRQILLTVFGLDITNPAVMPVTRDLSPAKRAAIQQWLSASQPNMGTPPPSMAGTPAPAASAVVPAARGGKLDAARRRASQLAVR